VIEFVKKVGKLLKREAKYLYLKNLDSRNYESFVKSVYKNRTNEDLDLENPQKYTEKMQYAKLYRNSSLKTRLTDKYLVREWVEEKIGTEYLIPLLGVWESFSDIDFNSLPDRFVLKTNHSSGWNLIINDKEKIDYNRAKRNFGIWLNKNYAYNSDLQLHYENIEPKILAEEFIQDSSGELKEYKFFCFDGKVYYCWFILENSSKRYGNVYDTNWNLQPWIFVGRENTSFKIPKPENYEQMINIATILSENFSHVRVDLYNVDGKIYFGEMTFTSGSGYRTIIPEKYNYQLGDLWNVKNN